MTGIIFWFVFLWIVGTIITKQQKKKEADEKEEDNEVRD